MTEKRWLGFALSVMTAITLPAGAWAGDGVVALQTADPSCADDSSNIYVDCGNGTVTDNRTGLVWLADANCWGQEMSWPDAMATVSGLSDLDCGERELGCDCGLEDGSSPGEWRLPSRKEWKTMVADAVSEGCSPTITSDVVIFVPNPCWSQMCVDEGECSFLNVQSSFYWSSTTDADSTGDAWDVNMGFGNVGVDNKADTWRVWPVRGGQ